MPIIKCVECGQQIEIDPWAIPYSGELACPSCRVIMQVYIITGAGTTVLRKYPSFSELKEIWKKLSDIEKKSLHEASLFLGVAHILQVK